MLCVAVKPKVITLIVALTMLKTTAPPPPKSYRSTISNWTNNEDVYSMNAYMPFMYNNNNVKRQLRRYVYVCEKADVDDCIVASESQMKTNFAVTDGTDNNDWNMIDEK